MARFLLETESVSSAADSINSLVSKMSDLSSKVSGYDTGDGDAEGFAFSSAKDAIASNLEACSTKFSNSVKILKAVVESHTALQNSTKYNDGPQDADKNKGTGQNGVSTGSGNNGGGYNGGGYSGGGYSGGGYSGGGNSGSKRRTKSSIVQASLLSAKKGLEDKTSIVDEVKDSLPKVIDKKITDVDCVYEVVEKQSKESKELFADEKFKYDDAHYATYNGKYVIACDDSVGKVGDVIKITKSDNTTLECVVGVNSNGEENVDTLHFVVDRSVTDSTEISNMLEKIPLSKTDITKIENCGNIKNYNSSLATNSNAESNITNTGDSNITSSSSNNTSTESTNTISSDSSSTAATTSTNTSNNASTESTNTTSSESSSTSTDTNIQVVSSTNSDVNTQNTTSNTNTSSETNNEKSSENVMLGDGAATTTTSSEYTAEDDSDTVDDEEDKNNG